MLAEVGRSSANLFTGTLLKLLVKDKLLHSGKVPVNTELRPREAEKRGREVERYGTLNEAIKV